MKKLTKIENWNGQKKYGEIMRVSNWITVKHNYNPHKNNELWDYVTDGNGYTPENEKFNKTDGLYLDYFRYNGRNYALNQFLSFDSIMDIGHSLGYIENKRVHYLSGWDGDNIFNPLMAEFDEYCEHVRLYQIIRSLY